MGQFRQHCHGCECDLVVRLNHKQLGRWRFDLEHIWQLMAIVFGQEQLGFCSMDRFQQRYRGYGYGLVEQLGHRQLGQLRSNLGSILRLMAIISKQEQLGSCSMGQFQQRYRGYEYGLVGLLGRRQLDQLRFDLENI
jgi:hypothetical protein